VSGQGTVGSGYVVTFGVINPNGTPRTGLVAGDFTVRVENPQNTFSTAPAVSEVGGGQYRFTLPGAFTTTHGAGEYGWSVELTNPPVDLISNWVTFFLRDPDDLETETSAAARAVTNQAEHDQTQADVALVETEAAAAAREVTNTAEHAQTQLDIANLNDPDVAAIADGVWDEARAGHVAAGSFGEALDARVSLVETEAAAAAREITNTAEHDQTQTDIANLNDLDAAEVAAAVIVALTVQGYTAARALLLDNLDAAISTRAVPGDLMGLVAGAITAAKIAADAFTASQFDASMQSYQAKVWNFDDDLAGTPTDRYGVAFFKNGNFITAGIGAPSIRVLRNVDGVDLIPTIALVAVPGFPGLFFFEETSGPRRMVDGRSYFAVVTATIDAATRTWPQQIGRDNTP